MRIVVFGSTGRIGRVVVQEALARGHQVVAVKRARSRAPEPTAGLSVVEAYIDDADSVADVTVGVDAVVNAVCGLGHEDPRISFKCADPLLAGMNRSGCGRVLVVGTAGTLFVAPGTMRMEAPGFPEELRSEAEAHRDLQMRLRSLPVDSVAWTYFSPPALIEDGNRSGSVIVGLDDLLFNEEGESFISNQDYAMAAIDELERPRFVRMRFTAVSRSR